MTDNDSERTNFHINRIPLYSGNSGLSFEVFENIVLSTEHYILAESLTCDLVTEVYHKLYGEAKYYVDEFEPNTIRSLLRILRCEFGTLNHWKTRLELASIKDGQSINNFYWELREMVRNIDERAQLYNRKTISHQAHQLAFQKYYNCLPYFLRQIVRQEKPKNVEELFELVNTELYQLNQEGPFAFKYCNEEGGRYLEMFQYKTHPISEDMNCYANKEGRCYKIHSILYHSEPIMIRNGDSIIEIKKSHTKSKNPSSSQNFEKFQSLTKKNLTTSISNLLTYATSSLISETAIIKTAETLYIINHSKATYCYSNCTTVKSDLETVKIIEPVSIYSASEIVQCKNNVSCHSKQNLMFRNSQQKIKSQSLFDLQVKSINTNRVNDLEIKCFNYLIPTNSESYLNYEKISKIFRPRLTLKELNLTVNPELSKSSLILLGYTSNFEIKKISSRVIRLLYQNGEKPFLIHKRSWKEPFKEILIPANLTKIEHVQINHGTKHVNKNRNVFRSEHFRTKLIQPSSPTGGDDRDLHRKFFLPCQNFSDTKNLHYFWHFQLKSSNKFRQGIEYYGFVKEASFKFGDYPTKIFIRTYGYLKKRNRQSYPRLQEPPDLSSLLKITPKRILTYPTRKQEIWP